MADKTRHPFESIESAQEFMALLSSSIEEAVRDVHSDRTRAMEGADSRWVEALDLALYKLKLLEIQVDKSRRILNDLRTIRRLLFSERSAAVSEMLDAARAASREGSGH
jgi:hypothetical protein